MSHRPHHAIVATTTRLEAALTAQAEAERLGLRPSSVVESRMNVFFTFVVPPLGGNSGSSFYAAHEAAREELKRHLVEHSFEWVEVRFGYDAGEAVVTDSEWAVIDREGGE